MGKKSIFRNERVLMNIGAVLGAFSAVELLMLQLFFTKEETGRGGALHIVFLLLLVCACLASISSLAFLFLSKGLKKK